MADHHHPPKAHSSEPLVPRWKLPFGGGGKLFINTRHVTIANGVGTCVWFWLFYRCKNDYGHLVVCHRNPQFLPFKLTCHSGTQILGTLALRRNKYTPCSTFTLTNTNLFTRSAFL